MAVPSSGVLSLFGIANEIDDNDYTSDSWQGPISLEHFSTGGEATINTANASDNRPDGSAPHAMSEWYAYSHDPSSGGPLVGAYGNSSNTQMFSGNQGTGLVTVSNIDLSSAAYVGQSLIGATGHIFFRIASGTSYTSDAQVTVISYNNGSFFKLFSNTGALTGIKTTQATTNAAYNHSNFNQYSTSVASGTTIGKWNQRNGNTPSSGTGVNADALYYESSRPDLTANKHIYLRFPEVTFTSNTMSFSGYGYGSTMGTLFLGIYITG